MGKSACDTIITLVQDLWPAMIALTSVNDREVQAVLNEWPKDRRFHPSPEAWEDQVLYFFLPDRFSDGKEQEHKDNRDGIVTSGTTPLLTSADRNSALKEFRIRKAWMAAGSHFVGGTLRGATSKLGYLKRLGITTVWVGPVFKQVRDLPRSYHGYAVQDFFAVDPRFGTRDDLQQLVRTSHSLGIYVVLDIILNHCGDVFAYKERHVPYTGRRYGVAGWWPAVRSRHHLLPFDDRVADPDAGVWPVELQDPACFYAKGEIRNWDASPEYVEGDFHSLKSLDLGSPDPRHFTPTKALRVLTKVYKFWLAFADADGFRIDTVKHMGDPATAYFVRELRTFAATRLGKTNLLLVGEIAGPHAHSTVAATDLSAALGVGAAQPALHRVPQGLAEPQSYFGLFRNGRGARGEDGGTAWRGDALVTMLDDHDQLWRGDGPKARFAASPDGAKRLRPALALNLCAMGVPCVYYGSEQGFDGASEVPHREPGHYAENFIREAMFGGAFGAFGSSGRHCFDEGSAMYGFVRDVAALRAQEVALRRGDQFLCRVGAAQDGRWFVGGRGSGALKRAAGIVAWVRVYEGEVVLCAINTRVDGPAEGWATVEGIGSAAGGGILQCLYPPQAQQLVLAVEKRRDGVAAVYLSVPPAGFVAYKKVAEVQRQRWLFGHF